MNFLVVIAPYSKNDTCTIEFLQFPNDFLVNVPVNYLPFLIKTLESSYVMLVLFISSSEQLINKFILGRTYSIICLPVQSGVGYKIAGTGNLPSHSDININSCMISNFCKNVSLLVNNKLPNKLSCTIPMTARLLWGVTMFASTITISCNSALVSYPCGTCIFISSPSKSAF